VGERIKAASPAEESQLLCNRFGDRFSEWKRPSGWRESNGRECGTYAWLPNWRTESSPVPSWFVFFPEVSYWDPDPSSGTIHRISYCSSDVITHLRPIQQHESFTLAKNWKTLLRTSKPAEWCSSRCDSVLKLHTLVFWLRLIFDFWVNRFEIEKFWTRFADSQFARISRPARKQICEGQLREPIN